MILVAPFQLEIFYDLLLEILIHHLNSHVSPDIMLINIRQTQRQEGYLWIDSSGCVELTEGEKMVKLRSIG